MGAGRGDAWRLARTPKFPVLERNRKSIVPCFSISPPGRWWCLDHHRFLSQPGNYGCISQGNQDLLILPGDLVKHRVQGPDTRADLGEVLVGTVVGRQAVQRYPGLLLLETQVGFGQTMQMSLGWGGNVYNFLRSRDRDVIIYAHPLTFSCLLQFRALR